MKRAYRLRRPEQFQRARRQGRIYSTPLLTLNVVPGRRRRTRCGFVVGKRIGTAVRRNRAKRRVREAVRLMLPHITPGFDLVFVARGPELLSVPFTAICQAAEQLLMQAKLWNSGQPQADAAAPTAGEHRPNPTH
jgi:ribonuclease P protein component